MHARLRPVAHRFSYRVASILIDLDRLPEASALTVLFSVNRANLVAFHEKDHGPRDGSPLRPHIDALLAATGIDPPSRIELLCYPTVLGYAFNPISVYFCHAANGSLAALVYQVHNTFGQSHSYVVPVQAGDVSQAGIRQRQAKRLYVSPFMEMAMTYHFRLRPPSENVALRILETDANGPVLAAAFHGDRRPASDQNLIRAVLQTTGIAWKVVFGIHFEALRLWLKGMKLQPLPAPSEDGSHAEWKQVRPLSGE